MISSMPLRREFPILEFDPEPRAIIEPSELIENCGAPEVCIMPFYYKMLQKLKEAGTLKEIACDHSIATEPLPLYEMEFQGKRIAVMTSGLGAPFAAGMLEFAIGCGCRKFLVIGSGGVLDKTIALAGRVLEHDPCSLVVSRRVWPVPDGHQHHRFLEHRCAFWP